jgi:hypothetical protein
MIVRSLDVNGDWTFGKGRNDYLVNNKAIVQTIGTRLNSFLGDCFFALDAGIDWFNLLGTKNQVALELAVRSVILNTPGVTKLVALDISLDDTTRLITMKYTVETVYTVINNGAQPVISSSSFLLTESGDILTTEDGDGLEAG